MDLFNIELNDEVVRKLGEHAIKLRMQSKVNNVVRNRIRAMSILGRPAIHHHVSESDEESASDEEEAPEIKKPPAINLLPQNRVQGFP
jgi:hypothetical protein